MHRRKALVGVIVGAASIALVAAAPAGAAKTRVEITRVVQNEAGDYSVKGRVHSPDERCKKRQVDLRRTEGTLRTDWNDRPTRRGKFSITVPQSEEGNTFLVRVRNGPTGEHGDEFDPSYHCRGDESSQFTLAPPS